MIVDAVEHVGQIGLRIDAVHLGRLDNSHGTCQCLRTRVGASEEPIFSSNSNWTQGPLGSVVIHGDTTVFQEQAK